jgi:uncharacterized protein
MSFSVTSIWIDYKIKQHVAGEIYNMIDATTPAWKPLNSRQRRVFGVLLEKAKTTPDVYPMTVNGILAGCNQKSNRDPVMTMTAEEVEQVLEQLRELGAVTEVQGVGRVVKYRHHFYEWLGVEKAESAVMCELLLRGAQTLGELRAHAARMEPIPDQAALKPIVDSLLQKKLMQELTPAGRGQIVSHNLYKDRELEELRAEAKSKCVAAETTPTESPRSDRPRETSLPVLSAPAPSGGYITRDMFNELQVDVAELRAELSSLREQVRQMEERYG